MKQLFGGMFALAFSSSLIAAETPYYHQVDVQGHRGARAVLPENSLIGFDYALRIGVDTLELDLGVSADGVVVVVHDQTINTTLCRDAGGKRPAKSLWIHELTLDEIKQFECGGIAHPKFKAQRSVANTRIPTLAEVFDLVSTSTYGNANSVKFNIETKSRPDRPHAQPAPQDFADAVIRVVDKYNLRDRTTLQSFDHRTLIEAKRIAPDLKLSALFRRTPKDWVQATEAAQADVASPRFTLITQDDVQTLQTAGLKVIPWTANQAEDWESLLAMGVDGIITDNPEALLKRLGRR